MLDGRAGIVEAGETASLGEGIAFGDEATDVIVPGEHKPSLPAGRRITTG